MLLLQSFQSSHNCMVLLVAKAGKEGWQKHIKHLVCMRPFYWFKLKY